MIKLGLLKVQLSSNQGFLRYSYHHTRAPYRTVIVILELITVQLSSNWGFLKYSYHQTRACYSTVTIILGLRSVQLAVTIILGLRTVQLPSSQGFIQYSCHQTRASSVIPYSAFLFMNKIFLHVESDSMHLFARAVPNLFHFDQRFFFETLTQRRTSTLLQHCTYQLVYIFIGTWLADNCVYFR